MNNANKTVTEDHTETEDPKETDNTADFTPEDRVETADGRYGSVTGVDDPTGDITVLLDDGETLTAKPEDLIIVDEKGVDESEVNEGIEAGDEVELSDGSRGQVTGADDATGDIIVLCDDGSTKTVAAEEAKLVNDKSNQVEEKEDVEGQQTDGNSVEIKE